MSSCVANAPIDSGMNMGQLFSRKIVTHRYEHLITALLLMRVAVTVNADGEEALAKESQNPVGDIISLPFENNLEFGSGPEDARVNTLNLKPVYPVNLRLTIGDSPRLFSRHHRKNVGYPQLRTQLRIQGSLPIVPER